MNRWTEQYLRVYEKKTKIGDQYANDFDFITYLCHL